MVLISDTVTDTRKAYAAYKNRYRVERNLNPRLILIDRITQTTELIMVSSCVSL